MSAHATASGNRPETLSLVAAEKPLMAQRNPPPFAFLLTIVVAIPSRDRPPENVTAIFIGEALLGFFNQAKKV